MGLADIDQEVGVAAAGDAEVAVVAAPKVLHHGAPLILLRHLGMQVQLRPKPALSVKPLSPEFSAMVRR